MASRLDALKGLQSEMPKDLAKSQERARRTQDILLQNRARAAGPSPVAAQKAGADVTLQKGAAALEARAQQAPQITQVAQGALQARGIEQRKALEEQQRGLQRQSRRAEARLFSLDNQIKNELLDKQLLFKRDELGRNLFNERQLADYALASAQNQQDLLNYQQKVQQLSAKKMQILKAAHVKIKQEMQNTYKKESNDAMNKLRRELAQAEYNMRMKMQREQAKARNRAGMFGAAGSILLGGLGAAIGGPAGATAGATLGNGLFTAIAYGTE